MTREMLRGSLAAAAIAFPGIGFSGEWVMGPAFKEGWIGDYTAAVTAGYMALDNDSASDDSSLGLQFALNCPWFRPPEGMIRQQFNLNRFDHDGLELTSLEMNPRYFWDLPSNFTLGVGPGVGYVWTDPDEGKSPNLWSLQAGVDLDYRQGVFYFGVGTRYQWTENKRVGLNDNGVDNWLTSVKVGVNF